MTFTFVNRNPSPTAQIIKEHFIDKNDVLHNWRHFCQGIWIPHINEMIMKYVAVVPLRIIRQEKAKILGCIGRAFDLRVKDGITDFDYFGVNDNTLEKLLIKEQNYFKPTPLPPFKLKVGDVFRYSLWGEVTITRRTRCFIEISQTINGLSENIHPMDHYSLVTHPHRRKTRVKIYVEKRIGYEFGRRMVINDEYFDLGNHKWGRNELVVD